MASRPRILAFAGSARRESLNKKLVSAAARSAEGSGADVTLIDLADYPLPLFDGDLEAADGVPENARQLQRLFLGNHALLLACPEYNSSITPLLKNAIDWVSRPLAGHPGLACFNGKLVSLLSASPGNLGGLRGLVHVRSILANLGCVVLPRQHAISRAGAAFDSDGQVLDEQQRAMIEAVAVELVEMLMRLDAGTVTDA